MEYTKALEIAKRVEAELKPYCDRIQIAGSIRRNKADVKDIEIVAIPNDRFQLGLIVNRWKKIKGDVGGKYLQRVLPEGINLDLFFASEKNWGNILLIRTGDWEFSKKFMGTLLPQKGYKHDYGFLKYKDKIIFCEEEKELFLLAGIKYIKPENRNANAI